MSAPSQTTSAERLAELLDVKAFPPSADFATRAKVTDPGGYEQAAADAPAPARPPRAARKPLLGVYSAEAGRPHKIAVAGKGG